MRHDNLHIPTWVRKAFSGASDSGFVKLPRTGWNQVTMASFFRMDQRCWFISDSYWFADDGDMVCQPELILSKDDPEVIKQCDFLASLLGTTYKINPQFDPDAPDSDGGISVVFKRNGV